MFFDVTLTKIKILLTLKICFIHRNRSCYLGSVFFGVGTALKQHSRCFVLRLRWRRKWNFGVKLTFALFFSFPFPSIIFFLLKVAKPTKTSQTFRQKWRISCRDPVNLITCLSNRQLVPTTKWYLAEIGIEGLAVEETPKIPRIDLISIIFHYKEIRKHEYTRRFPI